MSDTDSFIDEVNEEVRRDRLFHLLKKYGWIAVLIILLIVGGAAWNEIRKAREAQAAKDLGDAIFFALEESTPEERQAALEGIEIDNPEGNAMIAFMRASEQASGGNELAAAATLQDVAQSADLPMIYRQIASFKALTLQAGLVPPEERRAGLEDLAQPGGSLRLLAEEQLALLDIEAGQPEAAIARLQDVIRDAEATPDLQQRALQVIVALGGEVSDDLLTPAGN